MGERWEDKIYKLFGFQILLTALFFVIYQRNKARSWWQISETEINEISLIGELDVKWSWPLFSMGIDWISKNQGPLVRSQREGKIKYLSLHSLEVSQTGWDRKINKWMWLMSHPSWAQEINDRGNSDHSLASLCWARMVLGVLPALVRLILTSFPPQESCYHLHLTH